MFRATLGHHTPLAAGLPANFRPIAQLAVVSLHVRPAPASRVTESAQVYVRWVEAEGGVPQNVGVLTVDKGPDVTPTLHRRFKVLSTPEEYGQVDRAE